MSNIIIVDTNESKRLILNQIKLIKEQGALFDIVLVAMKDKEEVQAHRLVLLSRSEYFKSKFTIAPGCNKLEIPDVKGKDLKNIINCCYSGKIDLENDNTKAIFATAYLLKLTYLIKACANFLANEINAANCLEFWITAKNYNCSDLLEPAKSYACIHFSDVSKTDEFLALDNERLRELLASAQQSDTSDDDILLSLISWIKHKKSERKGFVSGLVSLVRVQLLSKEFVAERKDFIEDYIEDPAFMNEIHKRFFIPLMNTTLLAVMTECQIGIQIQQYSEQEDKWTKWVLLEQDKERKGFGVVMFENELIIAGNLKKNFSKGVTSINMNSKIKETKAFTPMGTVREYPSLVVLNNDIYVVAGNDTKSVERWNHDTKKWNAVTPMDKPQKFPRAAALNGSIYVINANGNDMVCYNPATKKWQNKASMRERHIEPGFVVLKDLLYAIGGTDSKTVEQYDYETDTWIEISPLLEARYGLGCIAMDDRIIAAGGVEPAGGCNDRQPIFSIEEYDPTSREWTSLSSLELGGKCALLMARGVS